MGGWGSWPVCVGVFFVYGVSSNFGVFPRVMFRSCLCSTCRLCTHNRCETLRAMINSDIYTHLNDKFKYMHTPWLNSNIYTHLNDKFKYIHTPWLSASEFMNRYIHTPICMYTPSFSAPTNRIQQNMIENIMYTQVREAECHDKLATLYLQQHRNSEAKKEQEHVNRIRKKLGKDILRPVVGPSEKVSVIYVQISYIFIYIYGEGIYYIRTEFIHIHICREKESIIYVQNSYIFIYV